MSAAVLLPHQVEIFYNFEANPVCAGTVISSYLILTIASCVVGRNQNQSAFRIRTSGRNKNERQIRRIDQVFSYAALDSDPSPKDVVILRLDSELQLDGKWTTKLASTSQNLDDNNFSCQTTLCLGENSMSQVKKINCSEFSRTEEGNRKQEQNLVCTKPLKSAERAESCQPSLAGSGLVCSKASEPDFLYGALSLNSSKSKASGGKRMFTNVAAYSHWIQLIPGQNKDNEDVEIDSKTSKQSNKENPLELTPEDFGLMEMSFGGTEVDQTKNPVPYQLSLQRDGKHMCGAIILDKKTALAAAHCFDNSRRLSMLRLVAGEQNLDRNDTTEQVLEIRKVIIHPKFKTRMAFAGNNIAVIHVQGEFNFTERVHNVWISSRSNPKFQGVTGTMTGWGITGNSGNVSNVLNSIDLEFLDHSRCRRTWTFLKDSTFCALSNTSSACAGDSGGPLVIKNYQDGQNTGKDLLVGILAFGPKDCEAHGQPNGFTNVSHFYEWIAEKRSNSLCSSSQFQCFNGQCIDEELRCDMKFDCDDGSDEKVCQSFTRVTPAKTPLSRKTQVNQIKNAVPYQLSLRRDGKHICGAIILDKRTALTVAHCFDSSKTFSRFTLVAGEQNLDRNDTTEQVLEIQRVYKHPLYKTVFTGNDIAVIHINGEFNFNERVNNVWISSQKTPNFTDVTGTVTGWGKTTMLGNVSNTLQSLEVEFMEQEECQKRWSFLKTSMFCGYNNVSNVCSGETGGPLVIKNYEYGPHTEKDLLVGIPSFGPKDCEALDQPSGFTNVSHFYEWIAEKRSNSLCSPSQFQCFNGQCIDDKLRCDKKYDCEDGSDEKMCQSHTRVTRDCGGVIELTYSHEIQLKASSSHPHQNSSCIWIITNSNSKSNGDRSTTQIKIMKDFHYQFDNASSQLYILQNLTGSELSPFFLTETNYEYKFNQPILVLQFRTNHKATTTTNTTSSGIRIRITDKSEPTSFSPKISPRLTILKTNLNSDFNLTSISNFNSSTSTPKIFTFVHSGSPVESTIKIPAQIRNTNNFPYLLQLQRNGQHFCSAMILDKKTAVIPAHCVHQRTFDNYTLVAGHHLDQLNSTHQNQRQVLQIERVVKHPNYKSMFDGNDIALIHVKGEFNYTDAVNNVWISTPENMNSSDATGTVSVWGSKSLHQSSFSFKTFDMDVLSNLECQKQYSFLKESMFCGQRNFTNICSSSGGPLVVKTRSDTELALGILAMGPKECENITQPAIFTKLEYFYEWIEKNRANSLCSSSQFQCFNGQCISRELKCDKNFDCDDGSDEKVCTAESLARQKSLDDGENVFIILQPSENGGRIQVENLQLTRNSGNDSLDLEFISYRENRTQLTNLNTHQGTGNESNFSYFGDENEPVLIYLHSQHQRSNATSNSNESAVMSLSYSERPKVSPSNICGGVLELKDELEIVYQLSSKSQNQNQSQSYDNYPVAVSSVDDEVTCEWTIKIMKGNEIEATLFHNPQADFDSWSSSLIASTANIKSPRYLKIKELTTKYETSIFPYTKMTFTFSSSSSQTNTGFHLHLRNPSLQTQRSANDDNQLIVKEM